MVLCDVINAETEFMISGLQSWGHTYGGTVRAVESPRGLPLVTRMHVLQAEQRREVQWYPRL
jgi:hypothetical protein